RARGRWRVAGFKVATRFPFGLFVKAAQLPPSAEVLVYPAVSPISADRRRELAGTGGAPAPRRGRGHGLHNLREYRFGDDPRLIHWRSSAKSAALMVRELEADAGLDARLVLEGTGRGDPERLERGLAEAASLAVHLLEKGAAVELVGPGVHVPLGSGLAQRTRVLAALALGYLAASMLDGLARLLLFLLLYRLAMRNAVRDLRDVAFLAFFMLVAAAPFTFGVGYLFVFLVFLVAGTWMLMLYHIAVESERATARPDAPVAGLGRDLLGLSLGASVATLAITGALFFVIPRIGQAALT